MQNAEELLSLSPSHVTAFFKETREATEKLCASLEKEDLVIQSMPDASPVKWHLAHTTWFFETFLLKKFAPEYQPINAWYEYLFNSYYQKIGPQFERAQRGMLSRPTVEEVYDYRKYVAEQIELFFKHHGEPEEASEILLLGCHHEQQHQELILTDLKHLFSLNPLAPVYADRKTGAAARTSHAQPLHWVYFAAGISDIGHGGKGFCFDNEMPKHRFFIEPFEMASRLVTNKEYLAFMQDGGYEKPELWLADGWHWVKQTQTRAPLYWQEREGKWFAYTLSGVRPVEDLEPVTHVNYYEADAYARWAGFRLPTEQEWEAASRSVPTMTGNFLEDHFYHPEPAQEKPNYPLNQMFGDCWEWTSSTYGGYPGFRPAKDALSEYNGKFMCNQYVLRGGSCVTPRTHIRRTYRNFFAPDKQWQFTGIRLAKDSQ